MRALALVLVSSIGFALPAQEKPKPAFAVQLVLSADLAAVERWDGTNVPHFQVAETERVVRGQHFMLFPFFTGFALDAEGHAAIDLDVRIKKPGGGTYHEAKGMEAVRHAAAGKTLLLPADMVGVFFEPEDKLGSYRVEVVARDRAGKRTAKAEQTIELVEYAEGAAFADADEVWSWAWSYHHSPDPCRAAPAVRALAAAGSERDTTSHGALVELFARNEWLFPILLAKLADEDQRTRELLLWLLARSRVDAAPFREGLDDAARALLEGFASQPNPLADPLTGRADVNELLGRYGLARGRAPLLRLVLALAPEESGVVAELTLHEPTRKVDVPLARIIPSVVKKALGGFLDGTTRGYFECLREDERIPAAAREALDEILASDGKR